MVTREVHDQVRPSGFSLAHNSIGARLLQVEGVVVEEEFLHVRPVIFRLGHFTRHVVGGALAPRVSAERLRPEAEGALRRASARRVERNKRVEQERHVVAANVQVAPVNVGHVRQSVQILDGRPVGIMHDLAILAIGNAENIFDRLALRVFDDGVVEFLAASYVDYFRFHQRLLGQHADVGSDEGDLDVRIGCL